MEADLAASETGDIWYSRIMSSTDCVVSLNFEIDGDQPQYLLGAAHADRFNEWKPVKDADAPSRLYFEPYASTITPDCKDIFRIVGGLIVVSQAFRDVLVQFDLGSTRLFKVPILMQDRQTVSEYPPHYLLHVTETKDTVIPEESEEVEHRPGMLFEWRAHFHRDLLTVRASAHEGADLWADRKFQNRLFLTDRLKRAIDAAGVTQKGLSPVKARLAG